jgi:hypothetical protein
MMHEFPRSFDLEFAWRAGATVLELGSVPLPVVTGRIDRFIAEGGKRPYRGYGVSGSRVWGAHAPRMLVSAPRRNGLLVFGQLSTRHEF